MLFSNINLTSKYKHLLIFFYILFLGYTSVAQEVSDTIAQIQIEGNQRLESSAVKSYITINPGDKFEPSSLNLALKALFATGLFSEVIFSKEKNILIITVIENPIINRIAFEGNKRISDDELSPEVFLRPRTVFTRNRIREDVNRLITVYRRSGRFAVKIEPKVIQLDQNRVDLVFEIEEGPLTEIKKINIIGNSSYSDGVLKEVISSREKRWWRFFSSSDRYDPDQLNFDKESLRRFYLDEGFVDFEVTSAIAELRPERDNFYLTFFVDEGVRYKFGNVTLEIILPNVIKNQISGELNIKEGDWYSADKIEKSVANISDKILKNGQPFVEVIPQVDRQDNTNIVDINFLIQEGGRYYVNRIDILGNDRTLDKVIRRNVKLSEGDAFNRSRIARSRTLIQNLGFFENIDITEKPSEFSDLVDIEVQVAEQPTGELTFGAGYSTSQGAIGNVGVAERNLLGKGQRLSINASLSQKRSRVSLSFAEPYFLNRDLLAGFEVFNTDSVYSESAYDSNQTGFSLNSSYGLGEYVRQTVNYRLERQVLNAYSTASSSIKSQDGEYMLSSIGSSITYDTTDNRFEPNEGVIMTFGSTLAGLGGDKHFLRLSQNASIFRPVFDEAMILSLTGNIGLINGIGEDIEISDRFFLGAGSFKGFESSGIGPRDSSTDDSLGGNFYYTIKPEAKFNVGLPKELGVKGRLFSILGSLTEVDVNTGVKDSGMIRVSSGIGISWSSPFGPISMDLTQVWRKEDYDKTEVFSFGLGTAF